ncbi:MAG: hypothetical protein ACO3IN_03630 [Steroidobacteraceae bacterium]
MDAGRPSGAGCEQQAGEQGQGGLQGLGGAHSRRFLNRLNGSA